MPAQVIRNGVLIDGTGAEPVENGAVLIEDGKMTAAGPVQSLPRCDGVEEIDARGGYIPPGLIDAHVHVMADVENIALLMKGGEVVKDRRKTKG